MNSYLVYTDGSCWHEDRIGAYAWVIIDGSDESVIGPEARAEVDTTISCMELSGPIAALYNCYLLGGPSVVLLYSDSEFVVKGVHDPTRSRKKHPELWEHMDHAISLHETVVFEHVRGHAGDYWNEAVDKCANKARKEKQDEVRASRT